jgi:hypothetical protein
MEPVVAADEETTPDYHIADGTAFRPDGYE